MDGKGGEKTNKKVIAAMIAITLIVTFAASFTVPVGVSVNVTSYGVWTTIRESMTNEGKLIKLAPDGTEMLRIPSEQFGLPTGHFNAKINKVDGTIWVWTQVSPSVIVHLSADAEEILASWTVNSYIKRLTIDTSDGGVWLSGGYDPYTYKYSAEGTLIALITSSHWHWTGWVSVNSVEKTVWFTDDFNTIQKLKPDGSVILTVGGFDHSASAISVDETDGSLWVADRLNNQVVKLDTSGNELVRANVGNLPYFVVANPVDGGVWAAFDYETTAGPMKRLDSSGNVIATSDILFTGNFGIGLDIAPDGTLWIAEYLEHRIHKLSPTGELLLTVGGDPVTHRRPAWLSIFPEPTIPEAVQILIEDIEEMNLQQGTENSIDAKLQNVQDSLEALNADNRNDAINKLDAFINAIEAQRDNKISSEQADYLIAEAQRIINLIEE
jgi:hypothetical protein